MPDKRIPELPQILLINGSMFIAGYDPVTDTTYKIALSDIIPGLSPISNAWQPAPAVYDEDNIVQSDDKLWASNIDGNTDIPPYEGTEWREISKSKSGLTLYVPGTFVDDDVYVVSNYSGNYNLYRLINPARPFISADLEAEVILGDWEAFAGAGSGSAEVDVPYDEELLFDNQIVKFMLPHVQAAAINFSLAGAGNLPGGTIVIPITSDGVSPFNFSADFDFLYGIEPGGVLPEGDYEFYFLMKKETVSVSVPVPYVAPIPPFFITFNRATPDGNNLIGDGDLTGWDGLGTPAQSIPDGEDGGIEIDIVNTTDYIMIGIDTSEVQAGYGDIEFTMWANNPDYYYRPGLAGVATDSTYNAQVGDKIRIARVNAGVTDDIEFSFFRAGIWTVIDSVPGYTGELWAHCFIYTASATMTNVVIS